jgi:transcriptional regulator with AAA-type ATPase domain
MATALTKRFLPRSETRLQVSISAIFALLILPALGAIIVFSYYENVRNLNNVAQRSIDRARDEATAMGADFFEPVSATIRLKGRETDIKVYELLGVAGSGDPELRADQASA